MGAQEIVRLECRPETIGALAAGLDRFGTSGGEPEWLVSAVWLCTAKADFLATSSTKVLSDGYIARPLAIDRADDFIRQLRNELPDVEGRLRARNAKSRLPEPHRPQPPAGLQSCPTPPTTAGIVFRLSQRASMVHRVACALLFGFEGGRLLIGTDDGSLAMVLSEDPHLIDNYLADCELLSAEEYLARYGD